MKSLYVHIIECVCVCERERETERETCMYGPQCLAPHSFKRTTFPPESSTPIARPWRVQARQNNNTLGARGAINAPKAVKTSVKIRKISGFLTRSNKKPLTREPMRYPNERAVNASAISSNDAPNRRESSRSVGPKTANIIPRPKNPVQRLAVSKSR